jgi:signal transduction histidine kinase/CheY-like chemotaxis protein
MTALFKLEIHYEQDVVQARQRTRELAELLGFDAQDRTRLATAVSEIARNAFQYTGGGTVEFCVEGNPQTFQIRVEDRGEGIAHLTDVLEGRYTSSTGMGVGIVGTRRLMDTFEIESLPGQGTTVLLGKTLPMQAMPLTDSQLQQIRRVAIGRSPQNPYEEIQRQNQELLQAMAALRQREEELNQLNRELEDTNRGVVALYAELDEKANSLQKANELKTRFLSYMSHEFRTPLNSILSLSRMLLARMDGDLTSEQEKQMTFIQRAADGLSELVNDLLDLTKVEAGKIEVHPSSFEVNELFGALRGMLRPLIAPDASVALIFEEPDRIPPLYSDEGKVTQILRNFISNALKFTEQGEVRIEAVQNDGNVTFTVSDTGIGIAPEDLERIFEDFVQVESPVQKRVKGTGLGLPLSRQLAKLLGGITAVKSTLGRGSTFLVSIPIVYSKATEFLNVKQLASGADGVLLQPIDGLTPLGKINTLIEGAAQKILLIDDDAASRYVVKQWLANVPMAILEAKSGQEGLVIAQRERPTAIVLDLQMPEMSGFEVLDQLKRHPITQAIPVIIRSSTPLAPKTQASLAKHSVAILSKETMSQATAIAQLRDALTQGGLVLDS